MWSTGMRFEKIPERRKFLEFSKVVFFCHMLTHVQISCSRRERIQPSEKLSKAVNRIVLAVLCVSVVHLCRFFVLEGKRKSTK